MEHYISSSFVYNNTSKGRFTILNIYDEDEDAEENNIFYYKIPIDELNNKVITEQAFNPGQNNKCCIIS